MVKFFVSKPLFLKTRQKIDIFAMKSTILVFFCVLWASMAIARAGTSLGNSCAHARSRPSTLYPIPSHSLARSPVESMREWFPTALPTLLSQTDVSVLCLCQSDPLLVDPSCVLCFCPASGQLNSPPVDVDEVLGLNRTTCANATDGAPSTLRTTSLDKDPEAFACVCGFDPVLSPVNPAFRMCKCPQVLSCVESTGDESACTYAGGTPAPSPSPPKPSPPKKFKVPDSSVYTHFKNEDPQQYGVGAWAGCGSKFALCSMANCTTNSPALKTSDLGGQLAEVGIHGQIHDDCTTARLHDCTTARLHDCTTARNRL